MCSSSQPLPCAVSLINTHSRGKALFYLPSWEKALFYLPNVTPHFSGGPLETELTQPFLTHPFPACSLVASLQFAVSSLDCEAQVKVKHLTCGLLSTGREIISSFSTLVDVRPFPALGHNTGSQVMWSASTQVSSAAQHSMAGLSSACNGAWNYSSPGTGLSIYLY